MLSSSFPLLSGITILVSRAPLASRYMFRYDDFLLLLLFLFLVAVSVRPYRGCWPFALAFEQDTVYADDR